MSNDTIFNIYAMGLLLTTGAKYDSEKNPLYLHANSYGVRQKFLQSLSQPNIIDKLNMVEQKAKKPRELFEKVTVEVGSCLSHDLQLVSNHQLDNCSVTASIIVAVNTQTIDVKQRRCFQVADLLETHDTVDRPKWRISNVDVVVTADRYRHRIVAKVEEAVDVGVNIIELKWVQGLIVARIERKTGVGNPEDW